MGRNVPRCITRTRKRCRFFPLSSGARRQSLSIPIYIKGIGPPRINCALSHEWAPLLLTNIRARDALVVNERILFDRCDSPINASRRQWSVFHSCLLRFQFSNRRQLAFRVAQFVQRCGSGWALNERGKIDSFFRDLFFFFFFFLDRFGKSKSEKVSSDGKSMG